MCGNYSREEIIQGRKLYEEIRYITVYYKRKETFQPSEKKNVDSWIQDSWKHVMNSLKVMTLVHYTDVAESKEIVLMVGEFDGNSLVS